VIRQAVSCDICGAEKRQTNHWFVAYEQGGELRVSGWTSRHRSRPGSKHLCGQTCLHKLVDDFMARAIAVRPQSAEPDVAPAPAPAADASLTSHAAYPHAAYAETGSPIRLITPAPPQPVHRARPEPATIPLRLDPAELAAPLDEPPRYASRTWRAEAWEREREREQRAAERRPEVVARRGS
jgi:hypothetical protein